MDSQTTICQSSEWVLGPPLDQTGFSAVKFHPGPVDNGITFIRSDLPDRPTVRCCLENLRGQLRWTSLEQDNVWIHHTEHLLAAIAGAGIDNVVVEANTDRIPIVSGGSCFDFYRALMKSGIKRQDLPRRVLKLKQPICHKADLMIPGSNGKAISNDAKRYILGIPDDSFSVSYVFHVPHLEGLGIGFAEYYASLNSFGDSLSSARSYFLSAEKEEIATLLGSSERGFIVLTTESPNTVISEVAHHKVMDFLGDLMVLGGHVVGRFIAVRSGHQQHHEFMKWMSLNGYLVPSIIR